MNLEEMKDAKVILSVWDLKMIFLQGKRLREWEENRDEVEAMDEEYNVTSPEDFGDFLKSQYTIDVDGNVPQLTIDDLPYNVDNSPIENGSPENNYPTDTPKGRFVECIMRIANGEQIKYGEAVEMLDVDGLSPDDIVEVIETFDETGQFPGYIDGNGVDQDWNFDMNVKGVGVEVWGSITGGSCCLQTL